MRFALLFALALTCAALCQQEASAGVFRNRSQAQAQYRPMMQTPATIVPRREDLQNVPAAGGGRMAGYVLNLHPAGRAARIVLYPR